MPETNTHRLITERLQDMTVEISTCESALKRELREIIAICERTLREVEGGFNLSSDPQFIARHAADAAAYAAERQTMAREARILAALDKRIAAADAPMFEVVGSLVYDPVTDDFDKGVDEEARQAMRRMAEEATKVARAEKKSADAKALRAAKRTTH
jgi:hypothetical protein